MFFNQEKAQNVIKDMIYAQVGFAATINEKVCEKINGYIAKGKEVAEQNKPLDEEIKRTVEREQKVAE